MILFLRFIVKLTDTETKKSLIYLRTTLINFAKDGLLVLSDHVKNNITNS